MTSPKTLRRWPKRDFLAELERPAAEEDLHPFDVFARREARIRRLKARLRVASGKARAETDAARRAVVEDLRSDLEVAIFESAFNLGFEHGVINERTAGRADRRKAKRAQQRFRASIRRLLAGTDLSTQEAAAALLDFCGALAREPRMSLRRRVSRPSP